MSSGSDITEQELNHCMHPIVTNSHHHDALEPRFSSDLSLELQNFVVKLNNLEKTVFI